MLQQELAPCACGGRVAASPAFSLLFPMGLPAQQCSYCYDPAAGPPVDCTLSLGTPSTRRANAAGVVVHARGGRGGGCAGAADPNDQDSPPRRRCASCDTASTPLWRNGPRGPKSLCNACGIRYKKEQRRAAAAVAPATQDSGVVRPYACGGYARPPQQQEQQQQWGCYGQPAGKSAAASYGMYGGVVDAAAAAAADGSSCLSWMLNAVPSSPAFAVRDSYTLFQYY